MNKLEYLEEYHHLSQSLIGLIIIELNRDDLKAAQQVMDVWKPKLEKLFIKYSLDTCQEAGINIKDLIDFMKWEIKE